MAGPETDKPVPPKKARLVTFALLLIFAVVFSAYDLLVTYPNARRNGTGETVVFTVEKGIGPAALTEALKQAGLISSPGKFGLWLKLTGQFRLVKAGEFSLSTRMTPREILTALQGKGTYKGIRVTIPEGFTLSQIAAVLARNHLGSEDAFRQACRDRALLLRLNIPASGAEGFLFPDTYYFHAHSSAEQIIEQMHRQFLKRTAALNLPGGADLRSVITLASIVQAEAKIQKEAPVIAGVYRNRLNADIFPSRRLQADPTVSYGCDLFHLQRPESCDTFTGVLGSKQLADTTNPYNTYKHSGLPPGPICNPGLPAIRAALHPRDVPYLYFVVSKGGAHRFSTTLSEHQEAVKAYRQSSGQ